MTRKGKQTVERELWRLGAIKIEWTHGQKHEIAHVTMPLRRLDGAVVEIVTDISFARGSRDDVSLKRIIHRRVETMIASLTTATLAARAFTW